MVKKNGQINKSRINIKRIDNLIKDLERKVSIRVGIIGQQAHEKHEGSDLTNAELGAIHEFGGTINHPGGQPYYINSSTGKAVFVSKNSLFGQYLIEKGQVTKPHQIIIPTRSFLRMPTLSSEGKKAIRSAVINDKDIKESIGSDRELNAIAWKNNNLPLIELIANRIALEAENRVKDAFSTDGFGNWKLTTQQSKKQRKYNSDNPTLVDTGQLKGSITSEVKIQ